MYTLFVLFLIVVYHILYKLHVKAVNKAVNKERETIVRFLFDKSETYFDEYVNVSAGQTVEDMAWRVRRNEHIGY